MIANVPLTKRGAPIFHGKIDLRLLIKAVKRDGICNSLHSAGAFRLVSLCFISKILVVFWSQHMHLAWHLQQLEFYCAAGLICCAIKKKLVADYIRENYCFQVQSPEAPYLLSLPTFVGIFILSTHGGLRASLSAFCDIPFLASFLIPSPPTHVCIRRMTSQSRRAYSVNNFIMECYWSFLVIVTGTNYKRTDLLPDVLSFNRYNRAPFCRKIIHRLHKP